MQSYTVDPPSGHLSVGGLQVVYADPPIEKSPLSLDKIREAKLRGGKASSICNISAGLFTAGSEAMISGSHVVSTDIWKSGTSSPDWKVKGDCQDCNKYCGITLLSVLDQAITAIPHFCIHGWVDPTPNTSQYSPSQNTDQSIDQWSLQES